MDGIKGSSRKGTRAFDKFAVVWKALDTTAQPSVVISEPAEGEQVHQAEAADWRGSNKEELKRGLGLREDDAESESVSRASSVRSEQRNATASESAEELAGVKSDVTGSDRPVDLQSTVSEPGTNTDVNRMDGIPGLVNKMQHASTTDLPDGVPPSELNEPDENFVGKITRDKEKDDPTTSANT